MTDGFYSGSKHSESKDFHSKGPVSAIVKLATYRRKKRAQLVLPIRQEGSLSLKIKGYLTNNRITK